MAAVAISADSGVFPLQYRAAMHALQIPLDGMRDGNVVARQKPRIRMASGARGRLIALRDRGGRVAYSQNLVYWAVTGRAGGSITIAGFRCLSVNTLHEVFHDSGVTLRAFARCQFRCRRDFMNVAMAGRASRLPQGGVDALRNLRGLFRMACRALHLRDFRWVRKFLDFSVAVGAGQNPVHAGSMLFRLDGDVFSFFRFEAGLAVASQACFILFERLPFGSLSARSLGGAKKTGERNQQPGRRYWKYAQIGVFSTHRKLSAIYRRTPWRKRSRARFRIPAPAWSRQRPGSFG